MTEAPQSPLQKARLYSRYGYVPEPNWDILDHFADEDFLALKRRLAEASDSELIAHVDRTATAVFEDVFAGIGGDIVVPMSGGRDSRLILCMADEYGLRDRVITVTWGAPGALDWEIASRVAARFGVPHLQINTRRHEFTFADLKHAFDNGGQWTDLMSAHFNQMWRSVTPPGACAIVGYLGGSPIGCHYTPGDESLDLATAIAAFDRFNRRRDRRAPPIDPPISRLLSPQRLALPEQLDLVYRQEGYLRRVVAPRCFNTRIPFADPRWLRGMYALPPRARVGGNLFTSFLVRRFPDAFRIGTSGAYGLRADASQWRTRLQRQALRAAYAASNLPRRRGFATFDKYGDDRDLVAPLLSALHRQVPTWPHGLQRLARRAANPMSRRDAADMRFRLMLLCNLMCIESDLEQRPDMHAA